MGRRHHRFLRSEQLESRRPLAADLAALDVNDDMSVTALDALLVINHINVQSSGSVSTAEAEASLNCDTNSDGVVTPVDVLSVVNQINSGVVTVPTDSTDTTTSAPVDDQPNTETDATSGVVTTPVDEVDVTSPGDSTTDDTTTDDSATDDSDSSDTSDDSSNDGSTDPTDDTDGSDGSDDSVPDPTDGTDDSTGDDSSGDTTDDDTTDDDTTDDDTTDDSDDHAGCDHGVGVGDTASGRVIPLRGGRHGHGHGRGDLFADLDANGDGALSSDEVPDRLWNQLSAADADDSGSVTEEELTAYRDAQRLAAVEAFFEQLDDDGSGSITSADVSRMTWRFLSRADANNDGAITVDELMAVPLPGRWH